MKKPKEGETALTERPAAVEMTMYDPGLALGDEKGTENITGSDTKLAFLAIAQKTSQAIDPSYEGKFIEGLAFGDMYNTGTREVYGEGPLLFIPVRMQKRAHLKKDDGTLGDRIQWNDPRAIPPWEPGSKVQDVKDLQGMRIYDWAAVLVTGNGMQRLVISFQSTNASAGKEVNGLVQKFRDLARMAGRGFRPYQLLMKASVYIQQEGKNSWGKFKIEMAGSATKEQYDFCDAWFKTIDGAELDLADPTADTSEVIEGEKVSAGPARTDVDIPF